MESRRKALAFFEKYKDETLDRINHGIEMNRKGYAYLTVTDANGNPVPNVKISIQQKEHAFRFGANLFMLDELESDEKNEKYKEAFKRLFNMATLPFYWDTLEPTPGNTRYEIDSPKIYRRPTPDLCLKFCEENGIEPREHALAYDHFFPSWLKDKPISEVKRHLERRFSEISERYADKIPTVEVTNEMQWSKGVTGFYHDAEFLPWCYEMADKYFPYNKLAINETTHVFRRFYGPHSHYYMQIKELLNQGKRIDAVGLQYHLFHDRTAELEHCNYYFDPIRMFATLDTYATLGKPLEITEITVPAYSNEAADEAFQAEVLEWLYGIWFSHPAMEQIIYWNLPDGYAAFAPQGDMSRGENKYFGGLLRFDLSHKPAYDMLDELIHHRWHTETEVTTDSEGKAKFKGFYGRYELTLSGAGASETRTLSFDKLRSNEFEIRL